MAQMRSRIHWQKSHSDETGSTTTDKEAIDVGVVGADHVPSTGAMDYSVDVRSVVSSSWTQPSSSFLELLPDRVRPSSFLLLFGAA